MIDEMTTTTTDYVREVIVNYKHPKKIGVRLGDPIGVAKAIRKLLPDNRREHVIALYLDGSHVIVGYSVVSTGTANQAPVHPREIFQAAIACGACALIIAHNHPSGDITPSMQDRDVTKRIKEAGILLGIPLLDHVIVSSKSYTSFQERGDM